MYLIVLIPLTQSLRRSDKELLLGKKLSKVKERNLELQDKLENASNHYEERIQHLKVYTAQVTLSIASSQQEDYGVLVYSPQLLLCSRLSRSSQLCLPACAVNLLDLQSHYRLSLYMLEAACCQKIESSIVFNIVFHAKLHILL